MKTTRFAFLILALSACMSAPGKASKSAGSAPAAMEDAGDPDGAYEGDVTSMGRTEPIREEIETLWAEIERQREDGGMSEPLSDERVEPMSAMTIDEARDTCERLDERTSTCEDVCTLGDSICDNAASICRLAGQLGDDEWASGRCDGAKAACVEASQRCCDCS